MHIGIDLGTTNSLIVVFRDGKPEPIPNALGAVLTPSVVAIKDGSLIVGDTAREVSQAQPAMAAALFKRVMGTERRYKLGREEFGAPLRAMRFWAARTLQRRWPAISPRNRGRM
ncbi:Hsp70 family protein [Pseudorhodobacter sp. W20_MBD10_FR17]|uniref:Hsp70 family protein n=1 Tax=Pseudorhodobacter sp. W20_MBD10_FR17 TaxID=3240266 RepID=UPI003F97C287